MCEGEIYESTITMPCDFVEERIYVERIMYVLGKILPMLCRKYLRMFLLPKVASLRNMTMCRRTM